MMKYRKIPVVIDAHQWFKNGDHPLDGTEGEGKVVKIFININSYCRQCGVAMHNHGWIDTLEGGHIVCPGDWIIQGVKGEFYPVKNEIFHLTYEEDTP